MADIEQKYLSKFFLYVCYFKILNIAKEIGIFLKWALWMRLKNHLKTEPSLRTGALFEKLT
jgi:hypothetical protein